REDLPLGGMGVHPTPAERGEVLDGPLEAPDPLPAERRTEPIAGGVGVIELAEAGVAFLPGNGVRAADLPQPQIRLGWGRVPARPENVHVAVLAPEIDPAVADGRGGR